MTDDVVALLALETQSKGLFEAALDVGGWEALVGADGSLQSSHWLLAYEAAQHGWLEGSAMQVEQDSFFATLAGHGVRFYEPDAEWTPFSGPAGPLPGGQVPDDYV